MATTAITRFLTVQGPVKVEYITCTMDTSGDTIDSTMQRPLFAMAYKNGLGNATTEHSISGKTITITDADIVSEFAVNMIVIGF